MMRQRTFLQTRFQNGNQVGPEKKFLLVPLNEYKGHSVCVSFIMATKSSTTLPRHESSRKEFHCSADRRYCDAVDGDSPAPANGTPDDLPGPTDGKDEPGSEAGQIFPHVNKALHTG